MSETRQVEHSYCTRAGESKSEKRLCINTSIRSLSDFAGCANGRHIPEERRKNSKGTPKTEAGGGDALMPKITPVLTVTRPTRGIDWRSSMSILIQIDQRTVMFLIIAVLMTCTRVLPAPLVSLASQLVAQVPKL
jgi:hypothetical protein